MDCLLLRGSLLLFIPTTADLRYIDTHMTSSICPHLDKTQCGIRALKRRKSPGLKGTATPKVGK